MSENYFDVLIVGAGLSGIGMACTLKRECPKKSFAVLERRKSIGGTWDLFRYPGIRSDSDMFSFGYKFRPWNELKVLADGPSIRQYVVDTAREFGVEDKIQFGLKIVRSSWSDEQRRWLVTALDEGTGEEKTFVTKQLIMCTGYYNYDTGYKPKFVGEEDFQGQIIHPQHWPENLDYSGKRIVVIGSGATAVTLVPAMAEKAAHVTMLQRTPSYIFTVPAFDSISAFLRKVLPESWVYSFARKRNIVLQRWIYKAAKRWPEKVRKFLLWTVRKSLNDQSNMHHFTPTYAPWDQRICAVPDGDLFKALNAGHASVVTDHIETFTQTGIRTKSGVEIPADIIVSATGLEIQALGGMELDIDGETKPVNSVLTYKSVLAEGVPNAAWVFGYTNAPWTLKADLAAAYICRLLKHMDARGYEVAVPRDTENSASDETMMGGLNSGYILRASDRLPRQGKQAPWRVMHHYENDQVMLLKDPIEDGVLEFKNA